MGAWGLLLLSVAPAVTVAQQVPTEPASTHIFPAGGRRGTTVDIRVGGEFLPPHTRLHLVGDGISAPAELGPPAAAHYEPSPRRKPGGTPINYPREFQSQITIASDAQPGQRLWRVSSARGGTGGRPFIVGDLPEVIEHESNSTPETAESITLPVTLNGQIAGEQDHDHFTFPLAAGELVCIDVAANRLGSPLDPLVEVYGPQGQKIAVEELRHGSDPVVLFRAVEGGTHRVLFANLNFQGGPQYVYRATLTTAPALLTPFPAGGQAGTTVPFRLLPLSSQETRLAQEHQQLLPAQPGIPLLFSPSGGPAERIELQVHEHPVGVELEPNDTLAQANRIAHPVIQYGRLTNRDDVDGYRFTATAGEALTIACREVPGGMGSLPVVQVVDANGGELARASAVELYPRPCRLEWKAPAAGEYVIRVRDGGPATRETVYALSVTATVSDLTLTATTDILNVVQGNRAELELRIDRQGGLAVPIDLEIDGLPEGMKAEPLQIPPQGDTFRLALIASDDTRPGDSRLRIRGRAKLGDSTLERTVGAIHLGHDLEGVSVGSSQTDHVQLTVRHRQVFRLYCSEAYQYAHRGTIYPYLMEVERMNGFDGPIRIQMGDRQIMDHDGVQVQDAEFPAGVSQIMLPLYLPETMHINIQPHSNIYAQGYVEFTDRWGQTQSMLQVSEMRCMIRPLPTVAKLRSRERAVSLNPGQSQQVVLQLDRTSLFTAPLQVELKDPPMGIHLEPLTIAEGQTAAVATLRADANATWPAGSKLILRGTGVLPPGTPGTHVITEVTLPIVE
ncbi:MAG TPA: hypothetical protein DDY91_02260 [Planctomycetaceae bacterium]|nr:hypothetical protein [Planctomycetaceae bacterium]